MQRLLFGILLTTLCAAQEIPLNLYSDMQWRMIGPFRGGRTVACGGVPGQPNVFYIAANNGGVWKSTDYGRVWRPIFDDQPSGSIGALAIAPSDPKVVYVGSGEGLERPDLSVGDGIYKSSDSGKTWRHLGLRDAQQIPAILVDPHDANRLYVAALGHPYGPNAERGVFRSTDGGETWQKILYKDEHTGAAALAFDPSNPRKLYAVLWAARQGPWENAAFSGPGSGLFVSLDGGDTWRKIGGGLPSYAQGLGRIGIGIAPTDPRRMYALVEAPEGGLFRSDDAGENWRRVNSEMRIYGRGSDFANVVVDPRLKDVIWVANTSTYRSLDAGEHFEAVKGAPGGDDYHTIWINPENAQIVLLASDQGATITVNGGDTWSSWYNQPTAQFYHVITDNRFPYWVYGGQQESGSAAVVSRGDNGAITFRDWHPVGVEEYGYVAPDPLHPGIIYGGKATRYDEKTGEVQDVSPAVLRDGKYRFLRTMPILFSPIDPHILYLAGNVLFKTANGGSSWDVISPDLTRESYEIPASIQFYRDEARKQATRRGVIYALAPSPKDATLIWAGTDDGLIHVTHDGGKTWKNVTPPPLTPWSKVSLLEASHFDAKTAYAAVNRFRLDDLKPHIYATHDGGKTWREIVNGLPHDPVNAIREDPERKGLLFAATERAVYVSFDDGGLWQPLKLNMPPISVRDIVIHGDDLVAGTHGRGFWILDDITPLRQLTAKTADAEASLFRPETAWRVRWNVNTDTPLPPDEPAGKNPPDGAILNYYLKFAAGSAITLEILDSAGKLVRRYASDDTPDPIDKQLNVPTAWVRPTAIPSAGAGMHRFVWDLHWTPPPALAHEYPISAILHNTPREPRGPVALPGRYTVRLTVNGRAYAQPLIVKMDPRVKTPAEGLITQFRYAQRVAAMMQEDYTALEQVRKLRASLDGLANRAGALREEVAALDEKAAFLEGGAGAGRPGRRNAGAEGNLSGLNGELAAVLQVVDGVDASPTTQAVAAVADLRKKLDGVLAAWKQTHAEVAVLDGKLKAAGLRSIEQ